MTRCLTPGCEWLSEELTAVQWRGDAGRSWHRPRWKGSTRALRAAAIASLALDSREPQAQIHCHLTDPSSKAQMRRRKKIFLLPHPSYLHGLLSSERSQKTCRTAHVEYTALYCNYSPRRNLLQSSAMRTRPVSVAH